MKLPVTNEDLRTWFRQKWVRMDTKGNIKGDCAREEGEGKPKCLPSAKAHSMSKEDRAAAARRKRRQDPVADRPGKGGKPINVRTEEMDLEEANKPTNPALWSRAKALAKSKFDVYPSAYANGWAAKWYKSKGGGWKSVSEGVDDEGGMAKGELETIAGKAKSLSKIMKKNKQLDAWVQSKITKADDYIGSVHDYLKNSKQEVDEQMQKKTFFKLREQLDSVCIDCDDSIYGSVEEDFEPTGDEQYEDWDLDEAKDTDMYAYIDQSKGQVIKGKSGTYVGYTHSATKGKGANILKHNQTKKYYAAGGSSTAFTQKTTLHDTPEDAARAYHKGNLAEASKKPNATTRHLRDYPVSDKDVVKPVKKPEKKKPEQGVAEDEASRKTAPGWHSDSVKNPNFNDELSIRRVSPPGKRLKSGKLSADERGSQERTKALMKFKREKGGLTGPKSPLPEDRGVAEGLELQEAEKNGKKVQLNKPFRTSDGKGKFAVYTKNEKGNVVKVNFGDTTGLTIKTSNPDRRRNFRARHNCDNPGPKHKARYWSCRAWSRGTVSAGLGT